VDLVASFLVQIHLWADPLSEDHLYLLVLLVEHLGSPLLEGHFEILVLQPF